MRKASIGITPEGVPAIGLCVLVTLSLAMLGCATGSFVFMLLTWFCCHFFRDPERVTPTAPGLAVSPADGKVVRVQTMPDPFTGQPRTAVCIFMNVFSVHVNRAPVAGTVTGIAYHPGKFLNAAWDKASTDNERCAYQMTGEGGSTWTFVQIAGLIARRIVCRTDEGDVLTRGERFGMIRFGSRVDLYLPDDYSPAVNVGEQVFAGQTIVARRNA
ncbi:phosphatidylserine decarboxylase family protein [Desulfovibrio oxamicus]|uniref:Phosphatidylserine decarboxylase proenzyme n=1 Tax=Nitratidesulfovibrio oxamicus TaxID=32016 RepID=A0ABS0IZN7_9BACT|nr:phosphatidylserine decarboxylase family protein [Nitratidesulfovibrio oxamicus]MBG3875649.1 phosphatidylserine decarboxylase family protein [Nitratidesulfovibrio oxamicus]